MLWRSIQVSYLILLFCTFEVFPPLNDLFQLAEFPSSSGSDMAWTELEMQSPKYPALLWQYTMEGIRTIGFPAFMSLLMLTDTVLVFVVEQGILKVYATG